jgi:hypothetical protein
MHAVIRIGSNTECTCVRGGPRPANRHACDTPLDFVVIVKAQLAARDEEVVSATHAAPSQDLWHTCNRDLRRTRHVPIDHEGSQSQTVDDLTRIVTVDLPLEAKACGEIAHLPVSRRVDGEHTLDAPLTRHFNQVTH